MIEIPNLRRNILAGSNKEKFHTLTMASIQALFGHFVDNFPLLKSKLVLMQHFTPYNPYLSVGPLLVPALTVAAGHLHLLPGGREGVGHHGAGVLPPQLKQPREGEELGRGHEVVTHVLAQVIAAIMSEVFNVNKT